MPGQNQAFPTTMSLEAVFNPLSSMISDQLTVFQRLVLLLVIDLLFEDGGFPVRFLLVPHDFALFIEKRAFISHWRHLISM